MPKKKTNMLGAWMFLIGVILAVIFGFINYGLWLGWLLVIIGIIVGLLNISNKETLPFLGAGIVLIFASYFGGFVFSTEMLGVNFLSNILKNMLMIFVPATIIVALKYLFSVGRS